MTLFEWEKQTQDMCPCCRSRLFNQLHPDEREELIASVSMLYSWYDSIRKEG